MSDSSKDGTEEQKKGLEAAAFIVSIISLLISVFVFAVDNRTKFLMLIPKIFFLDHSIATSQTLPMNSAQILNIVIMCPSGSSPLDITSSSTSGGCSKSQNDPFASSSLEIII